MKNMLLSTVAAAAVVATAVPAVAQSAGDYMFGFGVGYVDPKSDNLDLGGGTNLQVDSGTSLTFTAEYYYTDNLAVELLLATPFSHDISVDGVGKIGDTKHLPPTLSLNYHFNDIGAFRPFVGIGINYTNFFEESSSLGKLQLDDSWGLAATLGFEYDISESGALRFDVRYIDIETDAKLNGTSIGTVEIDPYVFTAAYVWKF
ncbi:MAG: OmpW family outer membrane protein [Dinoroseobacter sp.]|nr:OmpW family outer membrane protein [Dinoroseobacter sp.]